MNASTLTAPATPSPVASRVPVAATSNAGRRWDPWPVGLVVFFAVFISCVAAFITFAVSQQMDLVRPDYYEEEIRYQVQLDRLGRTRALGPEAALSLDAFARRAWVRVPAAHVAAGARGTVTLYRPSDARADRIVALQPSMGGEQVVSMEGQGPGLWRVRVRWASGGTEYHLEDSVVLGR